MRISLIVLLLAVFFSANSAYADDAALVEQGMALKAKAENGDADAMMALAELLIRNAPEPKRPYTICDGQLVNPLIKTDTSGKDCRTVVDKKNQQLMELWKPVGTRFTASQWITKAAEAGNRRAISIKCGSRNDPLAPAAMREEAGRWCKKL